MEYTAKAFTLKITCAGLIDSELIAHALKRGFDGVLVVGCRKDSCRYGLGAELVEKRIENIQLFESMFRSRVKILQLSAVEGRIFAKALEDFVRSLEEP